MRKQKDSVQSKLDSSSSQGVGWIVRIQGVSPRRRVLVTQGYHSQAFKQRLRVWSAGARLLLKISVVCLSFRVLGRGFYPSQIRSRRRC